MKADAEKQELERTVSRKLRVEALTTCTWYYRAAATTLATSATTDQASCLASADQFVSNVGASC
jgi:hypothetical protein